MFNNTVINNKKIYCHFDNQYHNVNPSTNESQFQFPLNPLSLGNNKNTYSKINNLYVNNSQIKTLLNNCNISKSNDDHFTNKTIKKDCPQIYPKLNTVISKVNQKEEDEKIVPLEICISNAAYYHYVDLIYRAKSLIGDDLLSFMEDKSEQEVKVLLNVPDIVNNLRSTFLNKCHYGMIPRPLNAFMLYRNHQIQILKSSPFYSIFRQQDINKCIGILWKEETAEIIKTFKHKQNIHEIIYQYIFPGYTYIQRKGKNKNNNRLNMKKLKTEKKNDKRINYFNRLSKEYKIEHRHELIALGFTVE